MRIKGDTIGLPKIKIGREHAYFNLTKKKAIRVINQLLLRLKGEKIILTVCGKSTAGKTTFCRQIESGKIKLIFPTSQILYVQGDYLDDYIRDRDDRTSAFPTDLRPQFQWVYEHYDQYRSLEAKGPLFGQVRAKTAKFLELNSDRLFDGNPFSILLYEGFDSYGRIGNKGYRSFLNEIDIDLPKMVRIYIEIIKNEADERKFIVFSEEI